MAKIETAHHTLRVRRRGHRLYLDIRDKLGNPVWSEADGKRVEVSMDAYQADDLHCALIDAGRVAKHYRPALRPLPDAQPGGGEE